MTSRAHKRSLLDISLIFLAGLFLFSNLLITISGLVAAPMVAIPDVAGSDAQAAISSLNDAGFHSIKSVDSSGNEVSSTDGATVLSQTPAANTSSDVSQTITLTLKTKDEKAAEAAAQADAEKEKEQENEVRQELDALKGQRASTAYQQFTSKGYTIDFVYGDTSEEYTSTVVNTMDESAGENFIPWIVTNYSDLDMSARTVTLAVNTQENIDSANAEDELKSKLDVTAAWFACRDYGKKKYPYGFTVHYTLGVITEEAQDSDTWFLKATCDVTNQYGATARNLTVECHVTGTTDNPQVVDFIVY
jgi:hypothetical protein